MIIGLYIPCEVGANSPLSIILLWFFYGLRIIILDLFLRSRKVDELFILYNVAEWYAALMMVQKGRNSFVCSYNVI